MQTTILSTFKNTFFSIITVLGPIIAIFGLCYPAFFTANAGTLITAITTSLLVTGFWFLVAAVFQNKNR